MMNSHIRFLFATLGAVGLFQISSAQVPQIINYQGRINVASSPFTGTGQFRFALVNGDGSTSYWSNDGTSTAGSQPTAAVSLPVANGLYVVPLGDTSISGMQAVPASVFTNSDVRLRVWFNDGTNGSQLLSPDQRITSVGYAMVAGTVPDGAIGSAQLAVEARPKHDRQMVSYTSNPYLALNQSGVFTDIPGISITTKSLGESGLYQVQYHSSVTVQPGYYAEFMINVDGVDVQQTRSTIQTSGSSSSILTVSGSAMIPNLNSGKIVKLRYLSYGPQIYMWRPTLLISGVPSSQVVP